MAVLRVLHTALVWLVVLPATAICAVLTMLLSLLPGQLRRQLAVTRLWARICLLACGCRLQVEGLSGIDPNGCYVLMANHQTAFDIPVVLAGLPSSLGLAVWAKRSLFSVPFLGWAMTAMGFVPVDRERRSTAVQMLARSIALVESGRSILLFPEETYSLDGTLLPFQRGGFVLAFKSRLPILPVGISGSAAVLAPDGSLVRPGRVVVRIGKPIPTGELSISERPQITERVRRSIAELGGAEG